VTRDSYKIRCHWHQQRSLCVRACNERNSVEYTNTLHVDRKLDTTAQPPVRLTMDDWTQWTCNVSVSDILLAVANYAGPVDITWPYTTLPV